MTAAASMIGRHGVASKMMMIEEIRPSVTRKCPAQPWMPAGNPQPGTPGTGTIVAVIC